MMRVRLVYLLLLIAVVLALPSETGAWLSRIRRPRIPTTNAPACVPTSGYDPALNWCYGTYCDENGQAIAWDDFNCKPSSTPSSTRHSTTPSTATRITTRPSTVGCFYYHHFYPPGTEITRGSDPASNWCWVVYCDSDGKLLYGDDFNCFPPSSTTIPTPTGSPLTTQPENVARRRR